MTYSKTVIKLFHSQYQPSTLTKQNVRHSDQQVR